MFAHAGNETDGTVEAQLEALEELEEVVEIRDEVPIDVAPPSEEQIDREEIRVLAGSRGDVIAGVRNLPGIAAAPAFDGGGDLAIRGTAGEDSVYLIDGVPIPLSMHFDNLQSILPSEMIERIEFSPGGFGVEVGRATGGVVSIITRQDTPDRWTGFAELSFINASGLVKGPISKRHNISFLAGFRRSIIDALLPMVLSDDDPVAFKTPPRYYDAQGRVDWLPSNRHRLTLTVLGSDDRLSFNVGADDPHEPAVTGDLRGRDMFGRAFARWQYDGDKVKNDALVSIGSSVRERDLNAVFYYKVKPKTLYARNALEVKLGKIAKLRAGGDTELVRGTVGARIPLPGGEGDMGYPLTGSLLIDKVVDADDFKAALWTAVDLRPIKEFTLSAGVRMDHYQRNGGTFLQPRVSATVQVAPGVALRSAFGTYSRHLGLAEAMRKDLRPERGRHLVAGIDVDAVRGVRVSVTGYSTALWDLVSVDGAPTMDPLESYRNQGKGTSRGVEVMARARRGNFFGWLAYTLSRSTRVDAPGLSERIFDFDQTHNLTAVGSFKLGRWRFGGRFRLASGLPYTSVVGSVYQSDHDIYSPTYGEHNSDRLALWHSLDVRVDRRFDVGTVILDAYLDIANVYANGQELGQDYSFDYTESAPFTGMPFLPSLGLRGTF